MVMHLFFSWGEYGIGAKRARIILNQCSELKLDSRWSDPYTSRFVFEPE